MLERSYRTRLINRIRTLFPSCLILKPDPSHLQGVPDIIVLYGNTWAALEIKRGNSAERQPNQGYFVNLMNDMSFASFISPDNEEEVLDALQSAFGPPR